MFTLDDLHRFLESPQAQSLSLDNEEDREAFLARFEKRSELPSSDKIRAIYTVIDRDQEKHPFYMRIGTAAVNKDGTMNLYFDAVPVNGKAHVRDRYSHKPPKPCANAERLARLMEDVE